MLQMSAGAPRNSPSFSLPSFNQETVRHILLGDYSALMGAMNRMGMLGYCEKLAWSEPLPTGLRRELSRTAPGRIHQSYDAEADDSLTWSSTPVSGVIPARMGLDWCKKPGCWQCIR